MNDIKKDGFEKFQVFDARKIDGISRDRVENRADSYHIKNRFRVRVQSVGRWGLGTAFCEELGQDLDAGMDAGVTVDLVLVCFSMGKGYRINDG